MDINNFYKNGVYEITYTGSKYKILVTAKADTYLEADYSHSNLKFDRNGIFMYDAITSAIHLDLYDDNIQSLLPEGHEHKLDTDLKIDVWYRLTWMSGNYYMKLVSYNPNDKSYKCGSNISINNNGSSSYGTGGGSTRRITNAVLVDPSIPEIQKHLPDGHIDKIKMESKNMNVYCDKHGYLIETESWYEGVVGAKYVFIKEIINNTTILVSKWVLDGVDCVTESSGITLSYKAEQLSYVSQHQVNNYINGNNRSKKNSLTTPKNSSNNTYKRLISNVGEYISFVYDNLFIGRAMIYYDAGSRSYYLLTNGDVSGKEHNCFNKACNVKYMINFNENSRIILYMTELEFEKEELYEKITTPSYINNDNIIIPKLVKVTPKTSIVIENVAPIHIHIDRVQPKEIKAIQITNFNLTI